MTVKQELIQHRGALTEIARRSAVSLSTVSKVLGGEGTSANVAGHSMDVYDEIATTGTYTKTEERPRPYRRKQSARDAMAAIRAKNKNT